MDRLHHLSLQWLAQLPRTWATFVAIRVFYIQEILKRDSWNHAPTNDNPADLASRGLSVKDTGNSRLWCCGPESLPHPKVHRPQLDVHSSPVLPEKRELKETSKAKNRSFVHSLLYDAHKQSKNPFKYSSSADG